MRIISGKYKGKTFLAPKDLPVRPTTNFAKEALFSILTHRLDFSDCDVLDLFVGIGSISFEFISRGAHTVTSVDNHSKCIQFLRKNCQSMKIDNMTLIKQDVQKFLTQSKGQYNIIFADPPYDISTEILESVTKSSMQRVKESGMLIIEHSKDKDLSHIKQYLQTKKYGGCFFSFFEN